jgi:hypothetical protein
MYRKSITIAVAGLLLAAAPLSQASAHGRFWHHGGWGLGLVGAAVVGTSAAILAAPYAVVGPPPLAYAPRGYYAAPPVYYARPPAYYAGPPVAYGYSPGYGYAYRR